MSYARSPRPSLVITVGIRCISLPPGFEPDARPGLGWRVGYCEVGAEVGDAAQRLEGKARRRQSQLYRRVLRPCGPLRVGAQEPRQLGVQIGRSDPERVRDSEQPLG